MTLQLRFTLLVLLLFAGLLGGLWLHDRINTEDRGRLRESLQQEREALVERLVNLTGEPLRVFATDYSPWDEMVTFVSAPDPTWARVNLDVGLATFGADAVWVFRPDLTEVYGTTHPDSVSARSFPFNQDTARRMTTSGAAIHCFVETSSGLWELRGAPIRPSDPAAVIPSPMGWFFAARIWDEAYLSQLEELLNGQATLADELIPTDPELIHTRKPLPDWQGRPVRELGTTFRAPALISADLDARTDLTILFAFGGFALLAFWVAAHYWVVRPLRQLDSSLRQRNAAPLGGLVRAGGEFGSLSRLVEESFQQEEKLRQIYSAFNAIGDAVFISDAADGRIIHVNLGTTRLLGYEPAEILGRTYMNLHATPPGGPADGTWLRCRDGHLVEVEAHQQVLSGQASLKLTVTVARDISDRRRLEQQRLRAQRLESLGTLAGGVAHDLNNMLTPVVLMLDELEDTGHKPSPALLTSVRASVKRGATMLRQLLTFGRGVDGERAPIAVHKLIEELGRIIESTFSRAIAFETDIARNLPAVIGDSTQLHQVLLNLCVNARDALPDAGGTIRVSAVHLVVDQTTATLWPDAKPGPYVRIEVTDNGTGIPPEIIDRIFDPFFTTKPADKGTGLGLSTTLGIIRGHGGAIRVRSELGHGTCFSILLPAATVTAPDHTAETRPAAYDGGRRTVLIVEDEELIRNILQRTLKRIGVDVLTANGGREGLELFHRHQERISLVMTDFQMPGLDGLAVLREIRSRSATLPVLVMSGRIDDTVLMALRREGVSGLVDKPFGYDQVLAAVRGTLG